VLRAILVLAIVLGIVIGGLLLLRRTANMQPPIPKVRRPPDDEDEDARSGW
jgi:hypothetical protein